MKTIISIRGYEVITVIGAQPKQSFTVLGVSVLVFVIVIVF